MGDFVLRRSRTGCHERTLGPRLRHRRRGAERSSPPTSAYTTVLTILRNLEAKGLVSHEAEGKAHRYRARVARRAARRNALAQVIDKLFHGSPEQLLAHLGGRAAHSRRTT